MNAVRRRELTPPNRARYSFAIHLTLVLMSRSLAPWAFAVSFDSSLARTFPPEHPMVSLTFTKLETISSIPASVPGSVF